MILTQPGRPEPQPAPAKKGVNHLRYAWKSLPAHLPLVLVLMVLVTAAVVENEVGNPDVRLYQCYAYAFWYGPKATQILPASQCQSIPQISQFHAFPREYPPLALVIFSLPMLGAPTDYPALFAVLMAILATIIYQLLLIRCNSPKAAVYFVITLLAGGLATSLTRFDMAPAALCLLSLVLAERKRWTLANVALALGVLIKIYPIVLFPLLFLAEQSEQPGFYVPELSGLPKSAPSVVSQLLRSMRSWRWKNALVFACLVLGISTVFEALSSRGAVSWASHLYLRPFAMESTGSPVLWLASFTGIPVTWTTSFGSLNIESPFAGTLSQGFVVLLMAGYVFIFFQQWKGKMSFSQACVAALLVLITTGKVFSPQYLLWLMPLMAISASRNRITWLTWVGICCLTTLIYPVLYGVSTYLQAGPKLPGFMPAILLRDGLFLALTVAYLFNIHRVRDQDVDTIK